MCCVIQSKSRKETHKTRLFVLKNWISCAIIGNWSVVKWQKIKVNLPKKRQFSIIKGKHFNFSYIIILHLDVCAAHWIFMEFLTALCHLTYCWCYFVVYTVQSFFYLTTHSFAFLSNHIWYGEHKRPHTLANAECSLESSHTHTHTSKRNPRINHWRWHRRGAAVFSLSHLFTCITKKFPFNVTRTIQNRTCTHQPKWQHTLTNPMAERGRKKTLKWNDWKEHFR